MHKILGSIILLCLFLNSSFAQQNTIQKEIVVVTATKTAENSKNLPVRVKVISQKEIEEAHASNLAELLNQKVNFYLKESPGYTATAWIRGQKSDDNGISLSSRVLLLVNGHPAGSGKVDTIPLISIERIEIIEGPMSVTYGSGATSGVINIITRKKQENQIQVDISGGTAGYQKGEVEAGFNPIKGLSFVLSASQQQRDDYSIGDNKPSNDASYDISKYSNTSYKETKFYLGFSYATENPLSFEGSFNYFGADDVGVPGSLSYKSEKDYLEIQRFSFDFSYTYKINPDLELKGTAYFTKHDRDNYSFSYGDQQYNNNLSEVGISKILIHKWSKLKSRLGFNLSHINLNHDGSENYTYNEPDSNYLALGAFLEESYEVIENLNIWIGGRYDYYYSKYSNNDSATLLSGESKTFDYGSARGGLSYSFLKGFFAKFNLGTGFRAPSGLELTGYSNGGGYSTYTGNPNLKPEKSFAYEASIGYDFIHKLEFAYGYQIIKDRIATDYSAYTFVNQDEAIIRYVELNALLNWGALLKVKNLFGTLSFKGVYNIEYKDKEKDENLFYMPEKKANIRFRTGYYKLLTFYAEATLVGKMLDGVSPYPNIGNFNIINLGFETTPFLFFSPESPSKGLKIYFKVNNLTDTQYSYVNGYPLQGRNYLVGLNYKYNF